MTLQNNTPSAALLASVGFVCGLLSAQCGMYWMTHQLCMLWALVYGNPPVSLHQFNWVKVWLAFLVENALLPFVFLYVFLCPTVEWSGVQYVKRQGRVVAVHHHHKP